MKILDNLIIDGIAESASWGGVIFDALTGVYKSPVHFALHPGHLDYLLAFGRARTLPSRPLD